MLKKGYVDTVGGQMHYRAHLDGEGPPLVLFHMTAATSESYESLMMALAGKVPTIAFDTPNYGESFRTTHEPTIEYIADVMLEALDNLGVSRFHTFGHHTGASIALQLAYGTPERTLSASLNGICAVDRQQGEDRLAVLDFKNTIEPGGGQIMRAWTRMMTLEQRHIPYPAHIKHRDFVAFLKAGEDWAWGYRAVFRDNAAEKLDAVKRPIFFVIGRHDSSIAFQQPQMDRHPEFESYVSEDYGLFYADNGADDLAPRLIDFMRRAEQV